MDTPIKVLVIDDSLFMRKAICEILESDSQLRVVSTAADGVEGLKKIEVYQPDVVVLDIDMPRMNGLSAIRHIMIRYPVPIVVFSSLFSYGDVTFEALELGVVDFIPKPSGMGLGDIQLARQQIVERVKVASAADIGKIRRVNLRPALVNMRASDQSVRPSPDHIIAVGAGFAGTNSVIRLISQLAPNLPAAIIAQVELPPKILSPFVEKFDAHVPWDITVIEDGQMVQPGVCYVGSNERTVHVTLDHRQVPCIRLSAETVKPLNKLFESSSKFFNLNTIGVLFSGLGEDGADGFSSIQQRDGITIAHKLDYGVTPNVTQNAIDAGVVTHAVEEDRIPEVIENALSVNVEYKVA